MKVFILLSAICIVLCTAKGPKVAPFYDIVIGTLNMLEVAKQTRVNTFTLAFVIGGTAGCEPYWGGILPLNDTNIIKQIKEFQASGGQLVVSFGGATGPYLEHLCTTPQTLFEAYKKVQDMVGTRHMDIDIEATVNNDNMNEALAMLQKERPDTTVSFTLMVQGDDYGLNDPLGVDVLKNAVKHGVRVDIVNPMLMEFGSAKPWGDAVISASNATLNQMKQVWPEKSEQDLKGMLGVTPMIGRNFNGKIFEVAHAKQLIAWAKENQIGKVSFWSVGRDNGSCPGGGVSATCSSIAQALFEFTKIFGEFN